MKKHRDACAIIHLDLDAFYASVEVLDNPELKGRPVIVGGSRRRGVVCSASYEARACGIHSAQPIAAAMRLCPCGIFLPVRMQRYREASLLVFSIFRRFTPLVEPLSIDEAFLDVTGSTRLFGAPVEIARSIKQLVSEETGLTISAGVGPSKFIAKIASDLDKPDGLTVVRPESVRGFLEQLPIDRLWGVGRATRNCLARMGITSVGDLSRMPPETLKKSFGKHGVRLHLLSRGIDERSVEPFRDAQSIGSEATYPRDITAMETVLTKLLELATAVARRLRAGSREGRTITLKIKYSDFVLITRSTTLAAATDDAGALYRSCRTLLQKSEAGSRPIRLLGITVSQLCPAGTGRQLQLFGQEAGSAKKKKLNRALDAIQAKYGEGTIVPGALLKK